jgi:hypothetical protein
VCLFVSYETHIVADVSYIVGQSFLQCEVAVVRNVVLAFNIVLYTENLLRNDQLIRLSVYYIQYSVLF